MTRVLVFDSGVGGLSIVDALVVARLPVSIDYVADNAWLPYGAKPDDDLRARVPALLAAVSAQTCADAVIVACNTASTIALDVVRARLTVPVIGVVPPIKPAAALTRTGAIGLLATPATVRRAYTDDLIARFADGVRVVRVGSTALVDAAEAKLSGKAPDPAAISDALAELFAGAPIDVVALACTHFPLLVQELSAAAPRPVRWLDSGEAIARRVRDVLALTEAGAARLERALFTDAAGAARVAGAFLSRGFSALNGVDHEFQLMSVSRE